MGISNSADFGPHRRKRLIEQQRQPPQRDLHDVQLELRRQLQPMLRKVKHFRRLNQHERKILPAGSPLDDSQHRPMVASQLDGPMLRAALRFPLGRRQAAIHLGHQFSRQRQVQRADRAGGQLQIEQQILGRILLAPERPAAAELARPLHQGDQSAVLIVSHRGALRRIDPAWIA